jgi:hypothetical protein
MFEHSFRPVAPATRAPHIDEIVSKYQTSYSKYTIDFTLADTALGVREASLVREKSIARRRSTAASDNNFEINIDASKIPAYGPSAANRARLHALRGLR